MVCTINFTNYICLLITFQSGLVSKYPMPSSVKKLVKTCKALKYECKCQKFNSMTEFDLKFGWLAWGDG